MKRALFLLAILGLLGAGIAGCKASGSVDTRSSSGIVLPR
jgi:hypothetical protein